MKHFYEDLDGFSSFDDQGELFIYLLKNIPDRRLRIAEIGVYKGRMTAMWVVELENRKKKYDYYAIDHFLGSDEHQKDVDYYSITNQNLERIKSKINIIKKDSTKASEAFPDDYFDIVYIDASHTYDMCKKDIETWLPKVKQDGILCGDDYIKGWPGVVKAVDEKFKKINKFGYQQWYIKKCEL